MSRGIDYTGIDPLTGTEIMDLIGASFVDLENPKRFQKLQEIIRFFEGKKDRRAQILKILMKNGKEDNLESVWVWVQLEQERTKTLSEMNPEDFTDDVQKEIRSGFLSKDKLDEIQADIAAKELQYKNQKREYAISRRTKTNIVKKESGAMSKVFAEVKLRATQEKVERYREISSALAELE